MLPLRIVAHRPEQPARVGGGRPRAYAQARSTPPPVSTDERLVGRAITEAVAVCPGRLGRRPKRPAILGYFRPDVRVVPPGVLPLFSRLKIVWGSRGTAAGAGGLLGTEGGGCLWSDDDTSRRLARRRSQGQLSRE